MGVNRQNRDYISRCLYLWFGPLKIINSSHHRRRKFHYEMHQNVFGGRTPPGPAPQAPSWIKGGRVGREGKGKRKGKEGGEGKGEGRERERDLAPETKFWRRHWRNVHVAYSSVRLSVRKTVLDFEWSFQKASSIDLQTWQSSDLVYKAGWPIFILCYLRTVRVQALLNNTRWICRSTWQQSAETSFGSRN